MHATPDPTRYTRTAVVIHWLSALLLLGLFAVGTYMADLPFSPQRLKLYNWHKWAGILALALVVVRILWRMTHRPPALPERVLASMPGWQRSAYAATHFMLYGLMIAVPMVGWAYSSAAGYPVVLFGVLPLPDWVGKSPELADAIKPWHAYAAWTLAALVALHVAAALKHHLMDRDGLLRRMSLGA